MEPFMKVGEKGKQLFRLWEGLSLTVYLDSGGVPTIGIGHALTKSERLSGKIWIDGKFGDYREGLTEAQCWQLLDQDLDLAEAAVNEVVKVPLTQNQFDTLVSLCFNIGVQAFKDSTLVRLLNQGQYGQVPTQLARWVYDNAVKEPGLIKRRNKETMLWNSSEQA